MSSPSSPEQDAVGPADTSPGGAGHLTGLGQRLRQAREARGLSAAALADRLRLGVEQLEALEWADRERLPEPVFVIAQARRVACALGLDITSELQALRASGELQPMPSPGETLRPRPLPATARMPTPEAAASLQGRGRSPAGSGPRVRPSRRTSLLLAAALLLPTLLWAGWRLRGSVASGGDPLSSRSDRSGPGPSRLSPVSGKAEPGAVAAGMVLLASREPSWVEVRRRDGTVVFRGLLRGARLFALQQGLEVMAARPDLVSSRIGSAAPQTLGPISEVRWRSLPSSP